MNHIILYQPEKPANTGNIMRTAMATGSKLHIIGPLTFPLNEASLKRAGLDYQEKTQWAYYDHFESFIKIYPSAKLICISRYAERVHADFDFSKVEKDYFLLFGSESQGLPDAIKLNPLHTLLRIPMVSTARSLNLSNAVAIIIYEVLRQQKFRDLATVETIKGRDFLLKKKR
jgi:tRNA (cytidine/uridine-2'-O-)-methyltransferase